MTLTSSSTFDLEQKGPSESLALLATDSRLPAMAVRLYVLLRGGSDLGSSAKALGVETKSVRKYERQLIKCGYLIAEIERNAEGVFRHYRFPNPPIPVSNNDRLAS